MNKQQIQALIDAKIAGQGSAVDIGGALPTILHEILEAAFAGANVQSNWNETDSDSPQFIQNKPSIPAPYSLPTASAETLGGVKVGENLSIDPETGVLSATGGSTPLIVEGTAALDEGDNNTFALPFTPSAGMPSKAQALAAYKEGKPVILKIRWGEAEEYLSYAMVITTDAYSNLCAFGANDAPGPVGVCW